MTEPKAPKISAQRAELLINSAVDITMNPAGVEDMTWGAKCLVAAALPYKNPRPEQLQNGCWIRTNGNYTLWVQGGPSGLPFGGFPRIFMIWLTSEAIRTGNRRIATGGSFHEFCRKVQIDNSRGKRGSGRLFAEQVNRLLTCRAAFISGSMDTARLSTEILQFAERFDFFFDTNRPEQESLFESEILLTENFFNEITRHNIPLDMRAVSVLRSAPLELDIYQWLAYRMYSIKGAAAPVSWQSLRQQFGTSTGRERDFRAQFTAALHNVRQVYPTARLEVTDYGLRLFPSPTAVPRKLIA